MKKLLFILSILTITSQAQDGFNFQGAAVDANGDELQNQSISIKTSVLSDSVSGTIQWQEIHSTTTDQFGLFNVVIGQGSSTGVGQTTNFDNMNWGSGNHYLRIEMDAIGGSNYTLFGTSQLMSVPYALHAKSTTNDNKVNELDSLMNIVTQYFGCTNPISCNYDSTAVIDNGSCIGLLGCTDSQSSNYDALATCDDGTCIPYVGMHGYGGVIYKISGNTAYVLNLNHEVSQSSMRTNTLSDYANTLNLDGYNDWNVPNFNEFDDICSQKSLINLVATLQQGIQLSQTNYWSTEQWCSQSYPSVISYAKPYHLSYCSSSGGSCPQYGPFLTRVYRSFTY